jgi:two-component system, OmpR family, sensor histidine kinase BaeS
MSPSRRRPRRRPPWWPVNEAWPPTGTQAWGGPWGRRHRRPIGCLFIVPVLVATGALTVGIWAVAAIVGLVSAPPIVVAGGAIALVFVGLLVVGAWRALRRMSAPIDDLLEAAARVERGDLGGRVPERGPAQMRSLARAFNQMSSRLADQDTRRRTFLADLAHELRTPLTVIDGQLEAIDDGIYPADAEHLAPVRQQTRMLEKLVEDLRTVALADAGSLTLAREPTDLVALAEESIAALRPQAEDVGIEVRASSGLPEVSVDRARIRQVIANLLTNAVRHTPAGGMVRVDVRREGESVVVSVVDSGSGIATDLLPHVFERFAKEPDSAGSGLGLAIARDLVEAHGGTIEAQSDPGRGTTVRFRLPL